MLSNPSETAGSAAPSVGVYLSDVSGAFDKVDAELLMSKLTSFGLNKRLLAVIRSWLRDRDGYVIVSCESSHQISEIWRFKGQCGGRNYGMPSLATASLQFGVALSV